MASEPTPMKKPDDEGAEREDLFAEELDDIDLDALLEDDEEMDLLKDEPIARKEEDDSAPGRVVREDSVLTEGLEVIEDAEIDLLAEDDEGPLAGSDSQEEDLGLAADESEPMRVDGSTNGRPPGSDSEDLLGVEEEPAFDLLADDDAPLKDEPVAAARSPDPEPEMDLLAEEPEEAALPLVVDEEDPAAPVAKQEKRSAQETVALTPPPGKKAGRFAGAKGKFGGKGKAAQKAGKTAPAEESEPQEAEAKTAKPAREKVKKEKVLVAAASAEPVVARTTRSTVPFVCSECYEEFLIPATYAQEMVSCPECLHVGKRPDSDFLRAIHVHKSGERKSFALAVGVGSVLLVLLLALVWMISPYGPGAGDGSTMPMVLLGASGLLTVVFIWLIVRFEGNRWEVYF